MVHVDQDQTNHALDQGDGGTQGILTVFDADTVDIGIEDVDDGVDGGVVNVYVHYLREKLEKNGERIIISTRNLGYKINERMVTLC